MGDSFQGSDKIMIQPRSSDVPYRFQITVASSSEMNDGHLPWGSNMLTFTVNAHRFDGSTAYGSSDLIISTNRDVNDMIVRLGYSSGMTMNAMYHLTFKVCASVNNSTNNPMYIELDFNRVEVRDG